MARSQHGRPTLHQSIRARLWSLCHLGCVDLASRIRTAITKTASGSSGSMLVVRACISLVRLIEAAPASSAQTTRTQPTTAYEEREYVLKLPTKTATALGWLALSRCRSIRGEQEDKRVGLWSQNALKGQTALKSGKVPSSGAARIAESPDTSFSDSWQFKDLCSCIICELSTCSPGKNRIP